MVFGSPGGGAVQVREDIREPIRPLPPSHPYYPLILLVAAGLLVTGSLIAAMIHFTRHPRTPLDVTNEGFRTKPREPEPVLAIREIPAVSSNPRAPFLADPAKVPPLVPEGSPDVAAVLARAQQLGVRANVAGIVRTILALTGKLDDAREMELEVARLDVEIRGVLAPLHDRPEGVSVDYFKPGDELLSFGAVARDPLHPILFAEALRSWLAEAQPGVHAIATIERDGRSFTQPMWFPDLPSDLTRRALPSAPKSPK
jgi:hypothetical protein